MVKKLLPPTKVYLAKSTIKGAGRGMFAALPIKKGETIEISPVIEILDMGDLEKISQTILKHYYYRWDEGQIAECLGYGAIYNHSYEPNATYIKHFDTKTIEFLALRDIQKDQEIFTNYNNGDSESKSSISWIDDIPDYNHSNKR
ncbi:MAG TPA: SET domain-containing protein [Candidatus Saccharimonadales bacterium]|nr:SET domain-containing protein [Candidatus Saccharimonadales bacterium]